MSQDKTSETSPQNFVIDLLALKSLTSIAVASTGTAYTPYFALPKNLGSMGLMLKFGSSGAVDVKVDLEEGNEIPADQAVDTNWAVGDAVSSGVVATTTAILLVQPIAAKYARLKLTGQGSNHASTVLSRAEIAISKGL